MLLKTGKDQSNNPTVYGNIFLTLTLATEILALTLNLVLALAPMDLALAPMDLALVTLDRALALPTLPTLLNLALATYPSQHPKLQR